MSLTVFAPGSAHADCEGRHYPPMEAYHGAIDDMPSTAPEKVPTLPAAKPL